MVVHLPQSGIPFVLTTTASSATGLVFAHGTNKQHDCDPGDSLEGNHCIGNSLILKNAFCFRGRGATWENCSAWVPSKTRSGSGGTEATRAVGEATRGAEAGRRWKRCAGRRSDQLGPGKKGLPSTRL